jgi:hypothetical protein
MGGFEGTSDLYRASSRMPAWRRRAHHLPRLAPARQFHDPAGVEGLFRLSDAARARAERERQAYWVVAQGDTLARKVASANAYHAANGFQPLEMTDAKTPSVKVEGKTVADFPLIAREWDEANHGDPASTPAGADAMVEWICDTNPEHRWQARVVQRCTRLTGCPDCGRVRGVAAAQKAQTTNQGENEVEEMTGRLVARCDRRRRNQPAWCEGGTGGLSGGRVGSAGADTRPSRLARRLSPASAARATATTRVGNQTWTSA